MKTKTFLISAAILPSRGHDRCLRKQYRVGNLFLVNFTAIFFN